MKYDITHSSITLGRRGLFHWTARAVVMGGVFLGTLFSAPAPATAHDCTATVFLTGIIYGGANVGEKWTFFATATVGGVSNMIRIPPAGDIRVKLGSPVPGLPPERTVVGPVTIGTKGERVEVSITVMGEAVEDDFGGEQDDRRDGSNSGVPLIFPSCGDPPMSLPITVTVSVIETEGDDEDPTGAPAGNVANIQFLFRVLIDP